MNTKIGQRRLNLAILLATVLGLTALTVPAYALDASLSVTADINASCTISTTDLSFNAYDAFVANASQDLTTSAKISTTCTLGATVKVIMGNGLHSTTKYNWGGRGRPSFFVDYRHMSNAVSASKLQYDLYTDENHTTVWNASNFRDVVGTGASQDMIVYGKVFKNQKDAAAGSYTDTVSIGVIY